LIAFVQAVYSAAGNSASVLSEVNMRLTVLLIVVALAGLLPCASRAGGWAATYALTNGTVAVTNAQANSSWAPVAVLWSFTAGTNADLAVSRVSAGHSFRLGTMSVTNATTAVWVPEAEYPFEYGDVLQITCTATNGVVQVIRKAQ
jgi:hypothetical protein